MVYDLVVAGASGGIHRWDDMATRLPAKHDMDKDWENVGKSAGVLAVCAVLILNATLALPFNVAARYNEHPPTRRASIAFRAFLALDAVAFVSSAVATFRSAILHNGALNARLGTGAFLRSLLNDNSRMFCRFCRRHSLFLSVALALVAYCVVVGTTIFLDRI